ncbi:hypothetical protein cypCar_00001829 [Cyprinus carpio]|nr:hypothetical protein cypCar_00001829 [Cyprinus carpio]
MITASRGGQERRKKRTTSEKREERKLHDTVKRKLENAGSPLGRDQVNGFIDGYPPNKKACVKDALGSLNGVSNGTVPPLSPLDSKHNVSTEAMMANGNHRAVGGEHNGSGLTDSGALRGSESDFRLKEMKQEPVDDILPCILPGGGVNGNNSLFPDLNLNDQDWSEIMEEFNRSVPYEDIQELFSDSFGDRKDPELTSAGAAQSLMPPDLASVKTEFSPTTASSAFDQDSCNGSPQDSGSYPSSSHVPGPGNTMTPQQSSNSIPGNHSNTAYMKQQQQQMQLISQQKQFLQRQMMVEQEKQRQQEQQLQRHLTRPPPQYQDQQNPQAQQNPFQQQQQVSQFAGGPPCLAQQHSSGFSEHTISGPSQPIGNVSSLSGPTPGTQRMFSQAQGMMGMGVGQNTGPSTGPAPAASQADMNHPSCTGGLDVQQVLYGNMPMHPSHPSQQRPPLSSMSAAYRQNVLAAQQQAHLKNQPNAAMLKQQQQQQQLARMPNSMSNTLANNMGSAMPNSMPNSIQGALPSQAQSWQQQPQQHPGLQPGSANGGIPAGFPNSGFQMQSRLSKLPNNNQFAQGGMGNSAAGRTLAGMNPGQMMPNMNQQRTNNPGMSQQLPPPGQQTAQQGQPQASSQTQQVLPDLGPFSLQQAGPNRTAGLQCSQAYQLNRTANQQLQFSYSAQSGGSLSGFSAETDLVDSLLKNPTPQEWMDDLDELLASHQ